MKNHRAIFFFLALSILKGWALVPHLQAQTDSSLSQLPPLEVLVEWALAKSPYLKEQEAIIARDAQGLKLAQKKWMDKVFTDVGYTLANSFSITNVEASNSAGLQSIANVAGDNYRAGLTIRLGLYDLLARKHLKKQEQHRVEASQYRAQIIAEEVRLQTMVLFKDLQLAQRLLSLKSEKRQTLRVQRLMAEKAFLQGEISTAELGRITELSTNADMDFETAVIVYEKAYLQLEQFVGHSLRP